jgi:hypothetical protein
MRCRFYIYLNLINLLFLSGTKKLPTEGRIRSTKCIAHKNAPFTEPLAVIKKMKRLFLIFFVLIGQLAFGQLILPENRVEIHIAKVSPTKVETIRLNEKTDEFEKVIEARQYSIIQNESIDFLKIKNDTLLSNHDREVVLTILQRETEDIESVVIECYIPRHFISFYDLDNMLIGAIEICFECQHNRTFKISDESELFLQAKQYDDLKKVFEKYGLIE